MNTNKRLYVIKPAQEGSTKPFISNLVLCTNEGVNHMKEQMNDIPFEELYEDYIEYKDGKNKPVKQNCIEFKKPKRRTEKEIQACIKWNEEQLKD